MKWAENEQKICPVYEMGKSRGQFMKWAISRMGCNTYTILVGTSNGRENLKAQWVDDRIMLQFILKKTGSEGVDRIKLAQDRVQWLAL
jgi:hypothetical protein